MVGWSAFDLAAEEAMFFQHERRGWHLVVLAVIIAVAAGVRIYHLGTNSLWEDEYFSVECSSGWARADMHLRDGQRVPDLVSLQNARPIWTIWGSMARDENHPPVYFILLRLWRDMFGDSVVALRSLSVITSLAGIVLLYFLGEEVAGPGAALWACAIMAVAWPQIQMAQQARSYPLVTADALACLLALVLIWRRGMTKFRMVWLFVAAVLLPLIHYMAATCLLALIIFAAAGLRGRVRWAVLGCLSAAIAAIVLLWGRQFVGQHRLLLSGTSWMVADRLHPVREAMRGISSLSVRYLVEPRSHYMVDAMGGIMALVIPLLLLRKHRDMFLWWIWMVVPAGCALAVDLCFHRGSLGIVKYTLMCAPALYLLIAMLWNLRDGTTFGSAAVLAPVLVVLSCLMCLPNVYTWDLPDWREFAQYVESGAQGREQVVLVGSDLGMDGYRAVGLEYNLRNTPTEFTLLKDKPGLDYFSNLHGVREVCLITDQDLSHLPLPAGATMERPAMFPLLSVAWKVKLAGTSVAMK